jgi:hypothetical protein
MAMSFVVAAPEALAAASALGVGMVMNRPGMSGDFLV